MVTNMPEDTKLSLSKPRTFLKTKLFSEFPKILLARLFRTFDNFGSIPLVCLMSTRPRQLLSIILSYNAPENGDQHARRYKAILKQTKDLFENQVIQRILFRLLGTKEITIAKEIEKSTKSNPPSFLLFSSQVFNSRLPLARAHSYINCYACGLEGLIARNCRARRGHNSQRYHNHVACTLVYSRNY